VTLCNIINNSYSVFCLSKKVKMLPSYRLSRAWTCSSFCLTLDKKDLLKGHRKNSNNPTSPLEISHLDRDCRLRIVAYILFPSSHTARCCSITFLVLFRIVVSHTPQANPMRSTKRVPCFCSMPHNKICNPNNKIRASSD
jgi:hypothetical protein